MIRHGDLGHAGRTWPLPRLALRSHSWTVTGDPLRPASPRGCSSSPVSSRRSSSSCCCGCCPATSRWSSVARKPHRSASRRSARSSVSTGRWPSQYLDWLGSALTGDFGMSALNGESVTANCGTSWPSPSRWCWPRRCCRAGRRPVGIVRRRPPSQGRRHRPLGDQPARHRHAVVPRRAGADHRLRRALARSSRPRASHGTAGTTRRRRSARWSCPPPRWRWRRAPCCSGSSARRRSTCCTRSTSARPGPRV